MEGLEDIREHCLAFFNIFGVGEFSYRLAHLFDSLISHLQFFLELFLLLHMLFLIFFTKTNDLAVLVLPYLLELASFCFLDLQLLYL